MGAIETKTMKTIVKGRENLAKILVNLAAAKAGRIELVTCKIHEATRHRDVGDVSAMHLHCCTITSPRPGSDARHAAH
jgi:hypothetical protein